MEKIKSLMGFLQAQRGEMKKSRYKIWLRAFLLFQFSAFFSLYFIRDIQAGYFTWALVFKTILIFIPVGFLMSLIVPMQADNDLQSVTLSLDRLYLFLIWTLVIAKLLASYKYEVEPVADVIMAAIIGIMGGRLSGICLRVRRLKAKHQFNKQG